VRLLLLGRFLRLLLLLLLLLLHSLCTGASRCSTLCSLCACNSRRVLLLLRKLLRLLLLLLLLLRLYSLCAGAGPCTARCSPHNHAELCQSCCQDCCCDCMAGGICRLLCCCEVVCRQWGGADNKDGLYNTAVPLLCCKQQWRAACCIQSAGVTPTPRQHFHKILPRALRCWHPSLLQRSNRYMQRGAALLVGSRDRGTSGEQWLDCSHLRNHCYPPGSGVMQGSAALAVRN
jgi:hypothetical protein